MGNNMKIAASMVTTATIAGTVAIVATASPAIGVVVGMTAMTTFTVNWAVQATRIRLAMAKAKAKAIEPTTVSNGDGSLAGWAEELRLRAENSGRIARINWEAANDAAAWNKASNPIRPYGRVELEVARRVHESVAQAYEDDAALARHDIDLIEAAIEAAETTIPARMTGEWGDEVSVDA